MFPMLRLHTLLVLKSDCFTLMANSSGTLQHPFTASNPTQGASAQGDSEQRMGVLVLRGTGLGQRAGLEGAVHLSLIHI